MLHIRVEPVSRGEVVVVVRGELDCATSGQLRAAITALLNRGGIDAIGLDLRGLELLDSIGIGTIVVAQRIETTDGRRRRNRPSSCLPRARSAAAGPSPRPRTGAR